MLVELMRPMGPELTRRWVAALLLAPSGDREGIVAAVERRIVEVYAEGAPGGEEVSGVIKVRGAPVQRDGYVEETIRTYQRVPATVVKRPKAKKKSG